MEGFISVEETVQVQKDARQELPISMSAELASDQYRVVLTWGNTPSDLDSHLCGPNFHIYYRGKTASGTDARLDLDDTTSYGPETTTFTAEAGVRYTFYVHDYKQTRRLGQSNATVRIYCGNELVAERTVPTGTDDYTWKVFTLCDGELTFDDECSDLSPSRFTN